MHCKRVAALGAATASTEGKDATMAQMATSSTDAVDAVLEKLLSVRGERPGKQVALEDNEIRMSALCGNQPVCRVHWPRWFRRAVRNRHRHAIEQVSRRWRGGRRGDSGRARREI